jgi:hypothetical protein
MASSTTPATSSAIVWPSEFVVEIATRLNQNVFFHPVGETLRGRWLTANVSPMSLNSEILKVGDLPGVRIRVDAPRRKADIFDPMGLPEKRDALEGFQKRCRAELSSMFNEGPLPAKTYQNMSDTDLKTWIYWIRRLVNVNHVEIISGSVPTLEEIEALPGKTMFRLAETRFRNAKPYYREELSP